MYNCKFCNKFNNSNDQNLLNSFDTILFETKNFIVTPTMGSLVEGWVLIISKSHFISVGQSSIVLKNELENLINKLKGKLKKVSSEVFVFEHGPCASNQTTGCGIDHLHVHIVPLSFDLFKKAQDISFYKWQKVPTIFSGCEFYKNNLPYLFIETPQGEKYIATDSKIPSQFFRRVVANELGIPDLFDWKQNYGKSNIERTLEIFTSQLQLT